MIIVKLETPSEVIAENPDIPFGYEAIIEGLEYLHMWHGTAYHDTAADPQVESLRLN